VLNLFPHKTCNPKLILPIANENIPTTDYLNQFKIWDFGFGKVPGLNDRNLPHIFNIRQVTIAYPEHVSKLNDLVA